MIITTIITFILIIAGTFVAIQLYDVFDNDLIQMAIIIIYGVLVVYMAFNLIVDMAFNAIQ